ATTWLILPKNCAGFYVTLKSAKRVFVLSCSVVSAKAVRPFLPRDPEISRTGLVQRNTQTYLAQYPSSVPLLHRFESSLFPQVQRECRRRSRSGAVAKPLARHPSRNPEPAPRAHFLAATRRGQTERHPHFFTCT